MLVSLLFLWLTACSQPVTIEMYAPIGENLALNMSDSLSHYDISFFTRADFSAFVRRPNRDIPLEVVLTAPSGRVFSEKVYFPTSEPIRSTAFSEDYQSLWRSECIPIENGNWSLSVHVLDPEWDHHIYGFGIIVEKKQ